MGAREVCWGVSSGPNTYLLLFMRTNTGINASNKRGKSRNKCIRLRACHMNFGNLLNVNFLHRTTCGIHDISTSENSPLQWRLELQNAIQTQVTPYKQQERQNKSKKNECNHFNGEAVRSRQWRPTHGRLHKKPSLGGMVGHRRPCTRRRSQMKALKEEKGLPRNTAPGLRAPRRAPSKWVTVGKVDTCGSLEGSQPWAIVKHGDH